MKIHGPPPTAEPLVVLDLSRHCIQTALRRRYEDRLAQYFKPGSDRGALEAEIALLQDALETLDFGALRSRWPPLAGGQPLPVDLRRAGHRILIGWAQETIQAPRRPGASARSSEK
jgi:hypothetical protein